VTFFKGNISDFIRGRVKDIMALNPWLSSRLVFSSDKTLIGRYFQDPKYEDFITLANSQLKMDQIPNLDYEYWKPLLKVNSGNESINAVSPLFEVLILSLADGNTALIMSISHCLADGHTYYQIYKMLSSSHSPIALDPIRNHSCKAAEIEYFESCVFPWMLVRILKNIIFGNLYAKKSVQMYQVSQECVSKQKESPEQKCSHKFISTNDVISSWFFKATNSLVGLMAMNTRSRVIHFHTPTFLPLVPFVRLSTRKMENGKDHYSNFLQFFARWVPLPLLVSLPTGRRSILICKLGMSRLKAIIPLLITQVFLLTVHVLCLIMMLMIFECSYMPRKLMLELRGWSKEFCKKWFRFIIFSDKYIIISGRW
jgi:hypothetical protein